MGKLTLIFVAALAIAAALILPYATQTLSLFGDDKNTSILSLFNTKASQKMAQSSSGYIEKVNGFISGEKQGQDSSMIDDYYNIVTDFYTMGWGVSFHFAQIKEGEDHYTSIERHEQDLAKKMGIVSTDKVLDTGSGVGGPARNIHKFTKAEITGISINEYQIEQATGYTAKAGMSDKVRFVQGDFTKMPFDNESYDKVYAIEATCHATDLYDVYNEIARVLKKGGIFGSYEWVTTANTDKSNQQHVDWLHDIEYGSGLPPMHSKEDVLIAAKKAGLELLFEEDYALDLNYALPWYHKLQMSAVSTTITHYFTTFMEAIGMAAPGSVEAHTALLRAVRGLVGGGQSMTFTPMHMFIFKKL